MAALKSIPFFIQTWSSAASDISGASHNKPEDGHREEYRGACEERLGGLLAQTNTSGLEEARWVPKVLEKGWIL